MATEAVEIQRGLVLVELDSSRPYLRLIPTIEKPVDPVEDPVMAEWAREVEERAQTTRTVNELAVIVALMAGPCSEDYRAPRDGFRYQSQSYSFEDIVTR